MVAKTVWRASEMITGEATLSYAGQQRTLIAASSQAVITFEYNEVGGGGRLIDYPISADCHTYTLDPGTSIEEPVRRSTQAEGVNVRLSPGTWTVTAVAHFSGGPGAIPTPFEMQELCASAEHLLSTSLTLTVVQ